MKNTATLISRPTQPVANGKARKAVKLAAKLRYGDNLEQQRVGGGRGEVFLGQQLQAVGQSLQPAELAAHSSRAQPVLNAAGDLPLHPDEQQGAHRHDGDQQRDVDQGGQQKSQRSDRPATGRRTSPGPS